MRIVPREKTALFIDGHGIYAAARALGFEIDFRALLDLVEPAYLVRAYYYIAMPDREEHTPIRPLVDWMEYNGYTTIRKKLIEYTDASGVKRARGSISVELAVDAISLCPHVSHIILFTNDGEYAYLVDEIKRKGVRVTLVSTLKGARINLPEEVRRAADAFVELADIASKIAKPARPERRINRDAAD